MRNFPFSRGIVAGILKGYAAIVIPLAKYRKAICGFKLSVGMRFGMMFETEDSGKRRCMLCWPGHQATSFNPTIYICTFNWPGHQATFAIFRVDRDDSPKSKIGI